MPRWLIFATSVLGFALVIFGCLITADWGAQAYMVGIGGAKPGDVIYLDTLAVPLRESLSGVAAGLITIGVGGWFTAFARRRRVAS
jgi:hypothetical protein